MQNIVVDWFNLWSQLLTFLSPYPVLCDFISSSFQEVEFWLFFFSYHPLNLSWVYYLIRLTEISRSEGVPLLSTGFKDFVSPLDFCLIHETKFVLAHRKMREYREESWSPNRQTPEGELILADTEVNPAKISRAWPTSGELPSQLIG